MKELENQKGVTLVALIVTIIILLILSSIVISTDNSKTGLSRVKNMYSDIKILSDKILIYYNEYGELPIIEDDNTGRTLGELSFAKKYSNDEETDVCHAIDYSKLKNTTLIYGNKVNGEDDIYIVNERTLNVYYLKGMTYNNNTYYIYE